MVFLPFRRDHFLGDTTEDIEVSLRARADQLSQQLSFCHPILTLPDLGDIDFGLVGWTPQ